MIKVISPDGRKGTIPEEKLESALAAGFKEDKGILQKTGDVAADLAIGVGKSGVSTLRGASSLGERAIKGIGRFAVETVTPEKYEKQAVKFMGYEAPEQTAAEQLIPESWVTPENTAQSIGMFAGDVAQFLIPGGAIMKGEKAISGIAQATKYGKYAPKAVDLFTRAGLEAGVGAGMSAVKAGKVDESAAWGAAIGAAMPFAGAALKKAGQYISPKNLISRAMGLPPGQKANVNKIAQTLDNTGKQIYDDIDDFALKNRLVGDRDAMVQQGKQLMADAKLDKSSIFKNSTETVPNKYGQLIDTIKKEYSYPGLEDKLDELIKIGKSKKLTAGQLERLRYLADDVLPSGAYMDATPLKTEGLQKMIDPIRRTLEAMDETGTLRKVNTDIRILHKLIGPKGILTAASQKSVAGSTAFRGMTTGITSMVAGAIFPPGAMLLKGAAMLDTILSVPQVASNLAVIMNGFSKKGLNSSTTPMLKSLMYRIFGDDALAKKAVQAFEEDPYLLKTFANKMDEVATGGKPKPKITSNRAGIPTANGQGATQIRVNTNPVGMDATGNIAQAMPDQVPGMTPDLAPGGAPVTPNPITGEVPIETNLLKNKGGYFSPFQDLTDGTKSTPKMNRTVSEEYKSYGHTFDSLEKEFDQALTKYSSIEKKLQKNIGDTITGQEKFVNMFGGNDLTYSAKSSLKEITEILDGAPGLYEKIPAKDKGLILEYIKQNNEPLYNKLKIEVPMGTVPENITKVPPKKLPKGEAAPTAETTGDDVLHTSLKEIYKKAPAAKKIIDKKADLLAKKYGGTVSKVEPKKYESAFNKVKDKYGGDIEQLGDVVRNTIIVKDKEALKKAMREIELDPDVIESTFTDIGDDILGYTGGNVKIRAGGIKGEIQLNIPSVIYAKEEAEIAKAILGSKEYNRLNELYKSKGGRGHILYNEAKAAKKKYGINSSQFKKKVLESNKYWRQFDIT